MISPRRVWQAALVVLLTGFVLPLLLLGDEPAPRRYALVVGVRHYRKDHLKGLKYAEDDAHALAALLRTSGYRRVVVLTQKEFQDRGDADLLPTAENIREQLKSLLEDRIKTDTVVMAFVGHGVQFKEDDDYYLCPMDARPADKKTLLAVKGELYKELGACKAGHRALIIDASRDDPLSGAARRARLPIEFEAAPPEARPPAGVAALFSFSKGQVSYDSDVLKRSIFWHYLMEGLQGKAVNDKGAITLETLARHTQAEVPDRAKDEFGKSARQRPYLAGAGKEIALLQGTAPVVPTGKTLTNSIGMKLALLPKGTFKMGSPPNEAERDSSDEGPVHEVEITQPFYMGVHEVTQAQYKQVMGSNPSYFSATGGGKDKVKGMDTTNFPVELVTYDNARSFCEKLSALPAEKAAGRTYRLPTEAEWEYACRAGTSTPFNVGDSFSSTQANFDGNFFYGKGARGPSLQRTTAVGSYRPNGFGLYDMHGNVAEWVADFYDRSYYANSPRADPQGPNTGSNRLVRGGGWSSQPKPCRSAYRSPANPTPGTNFIGVRVVMRTLKK
jgi:formylglycine-generating enzyme required for sulfatase activity